jgi:CRISPR-associated endonuclease Cas1
MAANQTVAQPSVLRKAHPSLKPHQGVMTLSGYGIRVNVDRGHLTIEDGIAADRRKCRFPRVNHGLKRLVVIGSDGLVSLAALRWLADQDASFVMLERDGSVLATTGPVRSSDVKLRRAQALALENGSALRISRDLIDRKLAGQEKVAMQGLGDESAASAIRRFRSDLAGAQSIDTVRLIESQAARAYWSAWRAVAVMFPKSDLRRVPEHWLNFGSRISPLTGSPRRAANPPNAILNYLYALLEAETRVAAATLGLDPGIGVLHVDTHYRDSLACDLMEPIRAEVDALVLNWLKRDPLPRNHFFEERDGNCRLMAAFASTLSQTAPMWARLVAPVAEWFAREIVAPKASRHFALPTRLTQRNKREVKDGNPVPVEKAQFKPQRLCRGCGSEIAYRASHCKSCVKKILSDQITEAAQTGRIAAQSAQAQSRRAATQKINARARYDWKPSDQPDWLTADFYVERVQPALASVSGSSIADTLNVSYSYADDIRKGRIPHPRHWKALAALNGVSGN